MMQPAFMPWLGFFELVLQSDCFICLDDFQFSVQSYQQRNRLFVNGDRVGWCTVPVRKGSFLAPLNRTLFAEEPAWRRKLWRRIEANYAHAAYFGELSAWLHDWLFGEYSSLADQNIAFIRDVCALLRITPEFRHSSEHPSDAARSWRVLDLLRWCGADCYLSARGSFEYMQNDGVFPVEGVTVQFQDFECRPYRQVAISDGFVPYLSTVDALFNVGPEETLRLVRHGTKHWSSWDEMVQERQEREAVYCEVQSGHHA
jgi:hypothetical protein